MSENYNHKEVFISGSRSQKIISSNIQESLNLIMKNNIEVLIGDSEKGIDKEICDYFRGGSHYDLVTVFTIKKQPRIRIEKNWKVQYVKPDNGLKPQKQQMEKDRAMSNKATWGLVVFDPIQKNRYGALQVSSGSLRNTVQMLVNKKKVKFFYLFEQKMKVKTLKSISDLNNIIESYKNEKLNDQETEIILSSRGVNSYDNPSIVKYTKIKNKLTMLVKNEESIKKNESFKNIDEDDFKQTSFKLHY